MNWVDCLKKDSTALTDLLDWLEAEKMVELSQTLASSHQDKNLDTLRGYTKALDRVKNSVTIEDREKKSFEAYKAANK